MTIYKPDFPEPTLVESSLFEYLFPQKAGDSPLPTFEKKLPAYIDGLTGRTLSRGDVEDNALQLATGIRGLGLKKNDVACLWGTNSLEWTQAAFGCMAAGLCISPANYAYAPDEIAHQVNDSGAQLIFLAPELLPQFEKARSHLKRKFPAERIVLLAEKSKKPSGAQNKVVSELFGEPGKPETFNGAEAQNTAWLCYSSGTTGLPKGVMTTQHNMTSQLQALNVAYKKLESGKDVILGILPFSHIYGLTVVFLQPLTVGCPVVVLPRFEEISVLEAIQKYRITYGLVVPPVLIIWLHSANLPKYDISSLHTLMSGAAPLSAELTHALKKVLPNVTLTQGYGMTEASPVVTTGEGRPGWCGKLLPTFVARLVTEDGTDAKIGGRGELWVKGPSVMKGYHNNPEATAKTLVDGGWLRTGDVLITENFEYQVVDRVKELIKYKGFQVAPAELEALLLQHPKVIDSGVIGVYDESQATELPRAYVVAKPGLLKSGADKKAFEKEIADWVATKVAQHKRLRGGVEVLEVIPKSPSGKILRKDLRLKAQAERDAATPKATL